MAKRSTSVEVSSGRGRRRYPKVFVVLGEPDDSIYTPRMWLGRDQLSRKVTERGRDGMRDPSRLALL